MATATSEQKEGATFGALRIQFGGVIGAQGNLASPAEVSKEPDAVLPKPRPKEDEITSRDAACEASTETSRRFVWPDISPLVRLVPGQSPQRFFKMLQQWEGIVTGVDEHSFWADIRDLTNRNNPPEIVQLGLSEVSDADRAILEQGVAFYWSIGYEQSPAGQRRRTSEIRVRRTPEWSRKSIDLIKKKAASALRGLIENGEEESARR